MPVRPIHIEIKSPTPVITSVLPIGTPGVTAYDYVVVAVTELGHTTNASGAGSTATGNAILTADNFNRIEWGVVEGAVRYLVYRTLSAGTPGSLGLISEVVSPSLRLDDIGLPGDAATAPAVNTTGTGRPQFVGGASDLTLGLGGTFTGVSVQFKGSNDGTTWTDEGAALGAPGAIASARSWQYVQAVCATWSDGAPTGTAANE